MTNISYTKIACYLTFAVVFVSLAYAQGEQDSTDQSALKPEKTYSSDENVFNQRIALELRDMEVVEALKFLASKIGLNMMTTKSVSGRVSLNVSNVSAKDIFDIMLRSNGLAYVKQGGIYTIMTEAEYKTMYGKNFYDMRQVKIIRLKYAVPEQAFTFLDALKSELGRVVVDQEAGNVLVLDTPERIQEMQKALAEFEKGNLVRVFTLKYAKASELEEILKNQLDLKKAGSIKADERSNSLIVQTLADRMEEIAKLIQQLDRQTKQVLIDTKIVKVNLSNRRDEGVEWEGLLSAGGKKKGLDYAGTYPYSSVQAATDTWTSREALVKKLNGDIGSYPFSGTTSNYSSSTKQIPGEGLHYGIINTAVDFDLVMTMLQTKGETRLLSNPKILAVNNQEAKIHVGERQAYVTTTTTSGSSTSTVAEEVNFVDVGIQLAITPTINDDGYVTMKIKPEVSSVSSTLTTPTNNKIPIIDTSLTETTVMVKDGTTVIIGGLRKEEKTSSSAGVPILSQIPFLKSVFGSGYGQTVRTELLVLITPHIISGTGLTTGDDRIFTHEPGAQYRDYQSITSERKLVAKDVPADIQPKSYRDFSEGEEASIKEQKHEPRSDGE